MVFLAAQSSQDEEDRKEETGEACTEPTAEEWCNKLKYVKN